MIDNPYRRKGPAGTGRRPPATTAAALDFDVICLPDAVLLEAVIAAENRVMQETETQQPQRRCQMGANSSHGTSMWQTENAVARTISQVSSSKSDDEASINDQRVAGSARPKWEGEDEAFMVEDEQDSHPGALTQMVQEECQSEDRERQRLADHLVKMRMVMEKFVSDQVQKRCISCKKGKKLTIKSMRCRNTASCQQLLRTTCTPYATWGTVQRTDCLCLRKRRFKLPCGSTLNPGNVLRVDKSA